MPLSGDLDEAINLYDIENLAKAKISKIAYDYIDSGAADEITVRWNIAAWQKKQANAKSTWKV